VAVRCFFESLAVLPLKAPARAASDAFRFARVRLPVLVATLRAALTAAAAVLVLPTRARTSTDLVTRNDVENLPSARVRASPTETHVPEGLRTWIDTLRFDAAEPPTLTLPATHTASFLRTLAWLTARDTADAA